MADAQVQPVSDGDPSVDPEVWEEEERRMRELIARLPPPIPVEELARQQGVEIPQRWEDLLQVWPDGEWGGEEDFDGLRERMRAGEIAALRRKVAEAPQTGFIPDDYETCMREYWIAQIAAWDREHAAERGDGA